MTNEEIIKFLQSKQIPQCGDKEYTADEEYEAYQRAIDALEQQPSDTVSRGAFEQVMWERDVAINQLKELGYGLGQKVEPCDNAVSRKAVDELSRALVHTTRDKADFLCNFWEGLQKLPPVTQKPIECDDAIRRDAVKKWICKTCPDDSECQRDCDVIKGIDALPPVTPQQKYGKWIKHPEIETSTPEYLMFYECSECGDKQCFCKSDLHKKRFCNSCGAKMQESEEISERNMKMWEGIFKAERRNE